MKYIKKIFEFHEEFFKGMSRNERDNIYKTNKLIELSKADIQKIDNTFSDYITDIYKVAKSLVIKFVLKDYTTGEIFIIKITDEYYLVTTSIGQFTSNFINYKCDQLHGLLKCMEYILNDVALKIDREKYKFIHNIKNKLQDSSRFFHSLNNKEISNISIEDLKNSDKLISQLLKNIKKPLF